MRFEYKPYVDQSVGTIAELMLRSGQIQSDQLQRAAEIAANQQLQQGQIAANAQLQHGQILGQTIGGITNALSAIPGNIEAAKRTALAAKEIDLRTQQQQMQVDALKRQQADEYAIDQAASPRARGGGPDDSSYAPTPGPAGPPMPPGGGPNDSEIYPQSVVPSLTPGVTPQTLPGSLGAMMAGPGWVPSPAPPSPEPSPAPGPPVVPTTVVPPDARPQSANPNTIVTPTRDEVLNALPWRLRSKVAAQFDAADKNKAELQTMQEALAEKHREALGGLAVSVVEHGYDRMAFNLALDAAEAQGSITPEQKQDFKVRGADEAQRKNLTDQVVSASKVGRDWLKDNKPEFTAAAPGSTIYNKGTGATGATIPKDAPDYTLGDSRYSGTTNQPIATNEVMRQHQAEVAAASRLRAGNAAQTAADQKADAKLMMDGIEAGRLPPLMPGRASPQYIALSAEAERRGFDLAGAITDWTATQTYLKTMNGNAQLGLRQAIGALPELLNTVDDLAKQWDAGQFPLLNKANLAIAKSGANGEKAASIARQLDQQISDVVSDLAVVYMKGNTPTDHGIELARTALASDWSRKTLTDMTALARKNVAAKSRSINNAGVYGASDDNPYAPNTQQQTAPPPVAPGTAPPAPAGWKYVPKPGGGWTAVEAK